MKVEIILEGWKQVSDAIKYSSRQTYRFFIAVRDRLKLRYYLGHGHRIKMTLDEIEQFKALIIQHLKQSNYPRPLSPNFLPGHGTICQGKLFD